MGSDSFKRRLSPRPPATKCKQCGVEKAKVDRADGLGESCARVKDQAVQKAAKWKREQSR